jgi:ribosomal protein L40E
VIAHAGGWDELLIAGGALLLFLLYRSTRARREDQPESGPCLYCGRQLGPDVERCPSCGFKALRASDPAHAPGRTERAASPSPRPTGAGVSPGRR